MTAATRPAKLFVDSDKGATRIRNGEEESSAYPNLKPIVRTDTAFVNRRKDGVADLLNPSGRAAHMIRETNPHDEGRSALCAYQAHPKLYGRMPIRRTIRRLTPEKRSTPRLDRLGPGDRFHIDFAFFACYT